MRHTTLNNCNRKYIVRTFIIRELIYATICILSIYWGVDIAFNPDCSSLDLIIPFIFMVLSLTCGFIQILWNSKNIHKSV